MDPEKEYRGGGKTHRRGNRIQGDSARNWRSASRVAAKAPAAGASAVGGFAQGLPLAVAAEVVAPHVESAWNNRDADLLDISGTSGLISVMQVLDLLGVGGADDLQDALVAGPLEGGSTSANGRWDGLVQEEGGLVMRDRSEMEAARSGVDAGVPNHFPTGILGSKGNGPDGGGSGMGSTSPDEAERRRLFLIEHEASGGELGTEVLPHDPTFAYQIDAYQGHRNPKASGIASVAKSHKLTNRQGETFSEVSDRWGAVQLQKNGGSWSVEFVDGSQVVLWINRGQKVVVITILDKRGQALNAAGNPRIIDDPGSTFVEVALDAVARNFLDIEPEQSREKERVKTLVSLLDTYALDDPYLYYQTVEEIEGLKGTQGMRDFLAEGGAGLYQRMRPIDGQPDPAFLAVPPLGTFKELRSFLGQNPDPEVLFTGMGYHVSWSLGENREVVFVLDEADDKYFVGYRTDNKPVSATGGHVRSHDEVFRELQGSDADKEELIDRIADLSL